ncbi:MAG: sugar ABC transporter substrate-binding protein [Candidatus Omnitrophica bacterium]|nr:sugar ABC transporter substrate-binding protein [Candidatus Omnitrophota bacterium]MCF7893811.1 sugar ABC transporter substrate-binding protein [Candidatus Omnitrophota bacterium]
MRKFFTFTIILLVCFSLVGCGKSKQETSPKVTIWHWMSDRQDAFEQLAKKYKQENQINIKFELFPHSAYTQKINAAVAANDLPDLFGILGEKRVLASFAKEGKIEDLTSYMQEAQSSWKRRFIDICLKVNSFKDNNIYDVNPGIYGVPIDAMSIQFLYNKKLLKEEGFDPNTPPQTFTDLLNIAKKAANKKDVYGFASGWGETWLIYCMATNYAFDIMGQEKFLDTIKGKVSYTDPDWIKVFSLFKDLQQSGSLAPGIITMNNKEAEQIFATNRTFFTFNGSWGVNTYQQINPELEYSTMAPPRANQNYAPGVWAGAGASFVVNAQSKNKKLAIEFLNWLTEKEQQIFLIKETSNLPSIKGLKKNIQSDMKYFLDNQQYFTHPRLWPENENSRVVEAINRGIQNIVIGEKTPQEVAEEVAKTKKQYSQQ